MTTLEHIAMEARPYPAHLLEGCETGLVLFAAAFLGHNDAIHFAEAGLRGTCIDADAERLEEMQKLYPIEWTFYPEDAWEFADQNYVLGNTWDVVSADSFSGAMMRRSLDSLELWCALARKVVTATFTEGADYLVPTGWNASLFPRAASVYWLVLQRV